MAHEDNEHNALHLNPLYGIAAPFDQTAWPSLYGTSAPFGQTIGPSTTTFLSGGGDEAQATPGAAAVPPDGARGACNDSGGSCHEYGASATPLSSKRAAAHCAGAIAEAGSACNAAPWSQSTSTTGGPEVTGNNDTRTTPASAALEGTDPYEGEQPPADAIAFGGDLGTS